MLPPFDVSFPARGNPKILAETIQQRKPSVVIASPIVWGKLGSFCERNNIQLSSVKLGITGGAPVPIRTHRY